MWYKYKHFNRVYWFLIISFFLHLFIYDGLNSISFPLVLFWIFIVVFLFIYFVKREDKICREKILIRKPCTREHFNYLHIFLVMPLLRQLLLLVLLLLLFLNSFFVGGIIDKDPINIQWIWWLLLLLLLRIPKKLAFEIRLWLSDFVLCLTSQRRRSNSFYFALFLCVCRNTTIKLNFFPHRKCHNSHINWWRRFNIYV